MEAISHLLVNEIPIKSKYVAFLVVEDKLISSSLSLQLQEERKNEFGWDETSNDVNSIKRFHKYKKSWLLKAWKAFINLWEIDQVR